jgi:hypothetical protein
MFQSQLYGLVMDYLRDTVLHTARCRWPVFERLGPAFEIAAIPALEAPASNAQLVECDLVSGKEVVPRSRATILHGTLGRGLRTARVFWFHLRSFVTTTRPKHSLNHNIKSVPLVLTGNTTVDAGSTA